ncbi:hypothetical protein [Thiocystis minor]|uniref:hypothetical protein n=1 Tax=Thiocystis minor TaxID=61597 RepID=UPI0019132930|nr:hypothetical protein [Thiocystis minor]
MGGLGSGEYQIRRKGTTTRLRQLDIRQFARQGLLNPGAFTTWSWNLDGKPYGSVRLRTTETTLVLDYNRQVDGGEWQARRETLDIEQTACNLGGYRPWFHCPFCWGRCAILYLTGHGFLCRTCGELNYPSTRQNAADRAMSRMHVIRRRLGWSVNALDKDGGKPEGMRWREYYRLVWKHDAELVKATTGIVAWLDKRHQQLEKAVGRKST